MKQTSKALQNVDRWLEQSRKDRPAEVPAQTRRPQSRALQNVDRWLEQSTQDREQARARQQAVLALSTGRSVDSVRPGTALRHNYAFEFDGPVPVNQYQAALDRYRQEQEQAARDQAVKELARQSAQTPWTQSVSTPGGRRMVEQWAMDRALEDTRTALEEKQGTLSRAQGFANTLRRVPEGQAQEQAEAALLSLTGGVPLPTLQKEVSALEDRERQLVRQQQEQERSWRIFGAEQSAGKPDAKALAEQAIRAGTFPKEAKYRDLAVAMAAIRGYGSGLALLGQFPQTSDPYVRAMWDAPALKHMTEKQKQTLAYLVGTGDYDRASQYLEDISWGLNAQEAEQESARTAQISQEYPVLGAAANVVSWPLAIPGYFETAGHALGNLVSGENKPVDYNSAAYAGNRFANATGEGVQTAARDWGTQTFGSEQAGDAAAFLAGTGLSIGQNATQIALLGPAALPAMGLSAAGSASYGALESGANAGEAFALGTGAGAIELLTEKFSLEHLVKLSGGYGGKQIVMDVLRQMGVEASEEAASEILNNIWNTAVMGDSSDYRRYVAALIEQGMSPEDAEKEAFKQFYVRNVAEAALGGALSGGVMGGGATVLNYVNARSAGRQLSGMGSDVTQAVIQEGLDSPKDSRSYQMAQAAQDRLNGGKTVSDAQLGGLYWANVEQIDGERARDGAGQEGAEMELAASEAELSGHGGLRPTWDTDAILRREALNGTERGQEGPAQTRQSEKTASTGEAAKPRVTMADFTDVDSPIWNQVDFNDTQTRQAIQQDTHREMVEAGQVVRIPESTTAQVEQSFPDLRKMKKSERTQVLRQKMNELKASLRDFLRGLKGSSFEFEVNGNVLEATLYDAGVREVMEKVTQDKASMLFHSEDVFKNARYLYSTQDYSSDPNIYRWNYFYTPVQIGDEIAGVRIAVRDMATPQESQIYNWGIKKDAALGDEGRGQSRISSGASSDASNNNIAQDEADVKPTQAELTQNAAALFEASKSLGQNGQKALAKVYDSGQSAADFFGGFSVYYQAGLTGKDPGAVRSPYAGTLSEAQRFAAYSAGQNDAKASLAKEKAAAPFARTAGDEAGLVYDEFVAEAVESGRQHEDKDHETRTYLTAETAGRINQMARDLGVRVRFAEQADPEGKANGSIDGSEIVLERDNPNPVMAVAGHELTHRMQDLAPEEFRTFRDLAVQDSPESAVEEKLRSYAAHGYTLTHEQAMNEVAADYAGRLMDNGALLGRFIEANRGKRTLLQRLRDLFRNLAARLRGQDRQKAQGAADRITAALETAYDAAAANAARLDGGAQGGAKGGETRYSLKQFEDGRRFVEVETDQDRFAGLTTAQMQVEAKKIIMERFRGKVIGDEYTAYVDRMSAEHYTHPANRRMDEQIKRDKMQASPELDNILAASTFRENVPDDGRHPSATGGLDKLDVIFRVNGRTYNAEITVLVTDRGRIFYDMTKFKDTTSREIDLASGEDAAKTADSVLNKDSVAQGEGEVKGENGETRFSLKTDSEGRELTAEQAEFFKDSKVLDEDGRLRVVYHGSDQDFTVFDRSKGRANMDIQGSFFSPWELDASGYGGKVRAFYLNVKNPASEQTAYKALRKFQGQDGAGIKAREYLESLGYDGVNNGDEEYIAFRPEQIKSVDNEKPTEDPDIRYSLKDSTITKSYDALLRENQALRERAEYWRGQTRRTTEISTDKKAVARAARELAEGYGATLDTEELAGRLQNLYDALTRGYDGKDETGPRYAWEKAEAIARDLAESAVETASLAGEFPELKQTLRDARIVIGREYDGDIRNEDFRRRYFGRLKLTSQGTTNVDSVYQELAQDYPSLFPADITHPADQLERILDVTDELYTVREQNPFSGDMEQAVLGITNEIVERFFELPQTRATFADRQAAKLEEAVAHGRRQARQAMDEQAHRLREQNRQTVQRAVQRERETRARQIKALKERYAQSRKDAAGRRADRKARDRLLNIAKRLQNKKLPEVNRTLLKKYIGELDTVAKSMTGATGETLVELKEWYDKQRYINPDFIADPYIEKKLERLYRRQIADLSAQEVADLTETLLNIENEIRTQRRLIDSQERRDIYAAGEALIRDVEASAGSRPDGLQGLMSDGIVTETLSPLRMARRITGYAPDSPLTRAVQELADGQRAMLDYQMKAEAQFAKYTGDKSFTKGFAGPKARGIEIAGLGKNGPVTATITPAMRASLYLHSLNDQNLKHIRDGGIRVPNWELYHKGKIAKAYDRGTVIRLTPSQVRAITAQMTQKERAFAMAAHRYFNQTSREAINAVSEKLKGYSIAQVENYFPIHTDTAFTKDEFSSIKFDGTVEGMGFLKERVNATNPILLRELNAELKQSYELHSKYVGLAIPVRNFNKLWNVETGRWVDAEAGTGYNGGEGGGSHGAEGISGEVLRGEDRGADAGAIGADTGRTGEVAGWAKDAVIEAPGGGAGAAVKILQSYGIQAVAVSDTALKARRASALALTEGGVVYISDALTEELAGNVGNHEAIHAIKQRGSAAYEGFLNGMGGELNFGGAALDRVVGIVTDSRFPGQDFMSLTEKQQRTVFDELNALVWGFHKADAQNAREQFGDVFQDYESYVQVLGGILEDSGNAAREAARQEQADKIKARSGERFEHATSVKDAVEKKWGGAAVKYIDKMMGDLQGAREEPDFWGRAFKKLQSNYAVAVLTNNVSVAMKQAASYPTAAAVLGWGPLAKAMKDVGRKGVGRVDLDLIAKYTPLQWYRSRGFSTQELGDMAAQNRQLPKLLNWVQGMDLLTTRKLWKASEYYVRDHNKALNPGTDAYYRAVAEVYNQVIEETQPNYTTMQRPQLLRSDNALVSALNLFKTQPFQNFNIVYDAAGELTAAMRRGDRGQIKAARAKMGRAVTSQLAQLAVFAGMTMAWAMLRGRKKKYEDEDGELTPMSVLKGFGLDMAGGAFAAIPYGSNAWEYLSSVMFGDTYYGMDAATVTAINDALTSLTGIGAEIGNVWGKLQGGEQVDWRREFIVLDDRLDDISKAAGLPYENVVNLVFAVQRQVLVHTLGPYRGEYAAMLWTTDPETKSGEYYDLLYRAMNNSPEEYRAVYGEMADSGYFPEDKIKNAMEQRMMKAQGVEHVNELERRWLPPEQADAYDATLAQARRSPVWKQAGGEDRDKAEDILYQIAAGTRAGQGYQEKIDGGEEYGLTETDYILYRLALSMTDQPNENGDLGTYTNDEVEAAIDMLTGLSDEARSYLWTSSGKSGKSNPYR